MIISGTDIRTDHLYLGPGKGGRLVVTHLPTDLSVAEDIPRDKSARFIQHKLLAALTQMLLERARLPTDE